MVSMILKGWEKKKRMEDRAHVWPTHIKYSPLWTSIESACGLLGCGSRSWDAPAWGHTGRHFLCQPQSQRKTWNALKGGNVLSHPKTLKRKQPPTAQRLLSPCARGERPAQWAQDWQPRSPQAPRLVRGQACSGPGWSLTYWAGPHCATKGKRQDSQGSLESQDTAGTNANRNIPAQPKGPI